VQYAYIKIN